MKTEYYNGVIYTGTGSTAASMVIENGSIISVGDGETADAHIDLKGRFVCPGFNDSHMHILNYGYALSAADLTGCTTSMEAMKQGMLRFLKEAHLKAGSWLVGRGWNHDYFQGEKRFPVRRDLDLISEEYPILVIRACGHIACANSMALQLAGITRDTVQPEGGCFDVDSDGEPTGVFREHGVDLIRCSIPSPSKDEIKQYLETACQKLNSFGITSAQSDDFLTFPEVPYQVVIDAYRELEAEGKLTVKVYEQSHMTSLEALKKFVEQGYHTGVGSDFFRIGPLKMLGDGSLGAETARLYEPYLSNPSTRGIAIYSQEQMDEMVEYAHTHQMQVAIHAIGDEATGMVIHSIESALKKSPREDHRHGIVHCQITTKEQLEKFAKLKLHAYIQSIFLDYDIHIIENRVGPDRSKSAYNFKTLVDLGVDVSNGSDCPVEEPRVMAGIQCAVTRATLDGTYSFLPSQALSMEEALNSYTVMGARASFEEDKKGKIMAGMAADFVMLEQNPWECSPQKLVEIQVCETYVDGIRVF